MRFWLGFFILFCGCGSLQAAPSTVTILVEFSPQNAAAYAQQMTHWRLLQRHAGSALEVRFEHVSLQRSFSQVQQSGYCAINKMRTPQRAANLLFSQKPLNVSPSIHLIRTGAATAEPAIDVAAWLAGSAKRKIGVAAGRSYGKDLDSVIKASPQQVYQVSGEDVNLKLWQMLQKGRVDAVLDYQIRIEYLRGLQQDQTPYNATKILGQPLVNEGFIVCNRTAHGQQLMQYFDQLMATPALQQALYQSYRQYFTVTEWQQAQPYFQTTFPAALGP
ncbi:MAG: transporter substrate-binding domain-containing protein [Rheinheimera sp.]|nr:transporter substrate-binding domain-containing protein [Rheinheimera sp.]